MPDISLPSQTHVPGTGSKPDQVPLDHAKELAPAVTGAYDWQDNVPYLYGHDLMRAGYYWEAHEVWEAVWLATPSNSPERLLLQALIQTANAQLKTGMQRDNAAARLQGQVEELRLELIARLGGRIETYMGVDIGNSNMHYIA
ncbi:DUF309 domain-containing protein [Anderseniella sp. Alg231-50]|uniref:DUF309 domain-containing protein n=1 Tax=Anderseniella sp. Alg231-50 TaxID=1922226 RepID=UPI00307C0E94